ncbi:Flp family type IVb pilin [Novosphingobium sp. JCM 18896]|uniref:Flp family type IVb pilin n=1 Tax=Novosphingobium sp. JCM 18896 TaxID=2989731 RepID=UPI002223C647|nr:Flp family type IVb pilin [Novosphingobium sp. JCM 18896]MCW1428582.1 Flp family type IVb pilin [Novosphingobium sp. JCM 18896]
MLSFLRTLLGETRGATAIEYGLIAALIVLAIMGTLRGMAGESGGVWGKVSTRSVDAMKAS